MNANMKKIVNVATPAVCAVALVLSVVAFNKTNAATTPAQSPVVTSMPAGQPVDLTFAAEKALPCVVYIKNTQNSKVQTVEYSDPSRISSLILSEDSSEEDKARVMVGNVNVRYRLLNELVPDQVLSSQQMDIS